MKGKTDIEAFNCFGSKANDLMVQKLSALVIFKFLNGHRMSQELLSQQYSYQYHLFCLAKTNMPWGPLFVSPQALDWFSPFNSLSAY